MEQAKGNGRKLYNVELCVVRFMLIEREKGWAEHVARVVEKFTNDDGRKICKERGNIEGLGVNWIIILKLILKK